VNNKIDCSQISERINLAFDELSKYSLFNVFNKVHADEMVSFNMICADVTMTNFSSKHFFGVNFFGNIYFGGEMFYINIMSVDCVIKKTAKTA